MNKSHQKEREMMQKVLGIRFELPPAPDYRSMSREELLAEGRRMYAGLQHLWQAELQLPNPNWKILEAIESQMNVFETKIPEVCQ
jgi:hypothetical protein